jgi:hypothetical protein
MWEGGALEERNKWLKAMGEKKQDWLDSQFDHKFYIEKIHIRGFLKKKSSIVISDPDHPEVDND